MANLQEDGHWAEGVYQWETTDYAEGGAAGVMTLPMRQLANRARYLKNLLEALPAALTLYDNDDMSPNSETGVASQQSIKAYMDALIAAIPAALTLHDNDDMSPDSAAGVASQQSIKAYVDSKAGCYLHAYDRKASATDGDLSTAGAFATRVLNTWDVNIPGASVSSNQIHLPAGTYRASFYGIIWRHAFFKYNQARLRCVAGTIGTLLLGSSDHLHLLAGAGAIGISRGFGLFTLTEASSIELQHYSANAHAFGIAVNNGEQNEYAGVEIQKIA